MARWANASRVTRSTGRRLSRLTRRLRPGASRFRPRRPRPHRRRRRPRGSSLAIRSRSPAPPTTGRRRRVGRAPGPRLLRPGRGRRPPGTPARRLALPHAGHRRGVGVRGLARRRARADARRELSRRLGVVGAALEDAASMHRDDRRRIARLKGSRSGKSTRVSSNSRSSCADGWRTRRSSPRRGRATRQSTTPHAPQTRACCSSAMPRRSSSRCRRPA